MSLSSLRFAYLMFGLLPPCALWAQPEHSYRCHHTPYYVPLPAPTPQQQMRLKASVERSDSFDILHHDIHLDIIDFNNETISGFCAVQFTPKIANLDRLPLDLLTFTIDSVVLDGQQLTYTYDNVLLDVQLAAPMSLNDTATVMIYYHGSPTPDPSWGGFKFQSGYAYNLGIGLNSSPYNMGRSWFPCFDNFVERATYSFHIRTKGNNRAYCIGTFLGQDTIGVDTFERHYEMNQLLPTYLVNTAVTNYTEINYNHTGAYGTIPVQLVARPADTANVHNTFSYLGGAVDALENWYGAYWWERVGYVMTPQGAMEHPTNIAYPQDVGVGGATDAHNRLMTHELAHCWWGNVVTLQTPSDMWIKEGNAEYGAHLFTEHIFGQEDFRAEVKANHRKVLRQAHFDDNGYHPLSGIPVEHAYGTHTYNKGASEIHNMRAYMGDSLFKVGQNYVLTTYAYTAINGQQYRNALATATGLDMNPFFDAWILGTGFAGYEINDWSATPSAGSYQIDMEIEQKLRGTTNYHHQTPLEVLFVSANEQRYTAQVVADGHISTVQTLCPFLPIYAIINPNNRLNIAQLADERLITQPTGEQTLPSTDVALSVVAVSDTAKLWVEHCWMAPDTQSVSGQPVRLSTNHYWRFEGVVPATFHAKVKIDYRANTIPKLDLDLLSVTEDSLILAYRRDPSQPWSEYPYYTQNFIFNHSDGVGYVRIDSLMLGEYAFANGSLPLLTGLKPVDGDDLTAHIFPNPSDGLVYLSLSNDRAAAIGARVELCDMQGKRLWHQKQEIPVGEDQLVLQLDPFPAGAYILQVRSEEGAVLYSEKIILN